MKIDLPIDSETCKNCGKCIIVCPHRFLIVDVATKKVALSDDRMFNELEDRLSGVLLNLIKEEIYRDGVVSEDEHALLNIITRNFLTFKGMLQVTEPILCSAKRFLFKKIWAEAIKDGVISQDEQAILETVINKLKITPNEKEQFIKEVETEIRAIDELKQKLLK